jgi:uncharacterized protein (DUF58 family)
MTDRKALIRQIRRIDIRTKRLVEGLQAGLHHSVFKGQGVEFADLREYTPGDDIRSIDWKVTARLNRPFIKEFTEERDQTFYFMVDISGSGGFGSSVAKREKGLEVVASLMFAGQRNNDRIGLCLFSDHMEKFVRAAKGRRHVISLLDLMISHRPESQSTDLAASVRALAHILKRECSVVIVSDFVSPSFSRDLAILRNHHEVIAIRITDPAEHDLPDVGYIELEDEESGEQVLVNTSDPDLREKYRTVVLEADRMLKADLARSGIPRIPLSTTEPYDIPLKRFFSGIKRKGRVHGRIL